MSERQSSGEDLETMEMNLIEGLRVNGIEDPAVRELLVEWTVQQENELVAQGDTTEAKTEFELKRARLYRRAGCLEDAKTSYQDAFDIAWYEKRDDICADIKSEMADL